MYLEVWVEKNAMFPIVKQILKDKQVTVVPCSGFISHSKLWEHTKRLKDKQDQGFKIVILYLGDLDPSGENMDIGLPNRFTQMRLGLNVWDKNKFECKRIAVKEEHVKKFGLLKLGPDPEPGDDPDTSDARAKLLRDPRREEFRRNHNGELFCVELEAMAAKGALEELAKIVKRAVDSYYDRKIWRKYKPYLAEDNAKKWLITKYEEAVEKIKEDWELDDEPPVSLEDVEGKEEQDEEEEDVDEID